MSWEFSEWRAVDKPPSPLAKVDFATFFARLTGGVRRLALSAAMTDYLFARSAAVILLAGILSACAPQGDSSRSRFAVYSTAYLTDDNQVVYAVNSGPRPKPTPKPSLEWTWTGDGVLGAPSISIDLGSQTATFFKGDQPVGKSPVSTGREGFGTPTGSFKVVQKNKNHVSIFFYIRDSESNLHDKEWWSKRLF